MAQPLRKPASQKSHRVRNGNSSSTHAEGERERERKANKRQLSKVSKHKANELREKTYCREIKKSKIWYLSFNESRAGADGGVCRTHWVKAYYSYIL